MAQMYVKSQNKNSKSEAYNKWFLRAVYPKKAIGTAEIADFIQSQASVKRSDVIAVLNELGGALNHYLLLGERVQLKDIGSFKVGFSSLGVTDSDDATAHNIYGVRVLFQPETVRTAQTPTRDDQTGEIIRHYTTTKKMIEGITFEETHENAVTSPTPTPPEP